MSPASYLTAPPRVAASIIAPARSKSRLARRAAGRRYDAAIALLIWISALVLVLAIVGSAVVLVLHARRAWRTFRSFADTTAEALTAVERAAAAAEARAASLTQDTARLQAAITRLEESLAHLAVLRGAAGDLRATVTGLRGAVPRK
jgi:cell shape-determining protein MreC